MTENPDNLVLEHLRAIREDIAALKHDIAEIKTTQAAMLQLASAHENRLSRIEGDVTIIKRRLEMREEKAE